MVWSPRFSIPIAIAIWMGWEGTRQVLTPRLNHGRLGRPSLPWGNASCSLFLDFNRGYHGFPQIIFAAKEHRERKRPEFARTPGGARRGAGRRGDSFERGHIALCGSAAQVSAANGREICGLWSALRLGERSGGRGPSAGSGWTRRRGTGDGRRGTEVLRQAQGRSEFRRGGGRKNKLKR